MRLELDQCAALVLLELLSSRGEEMAAAVQLEAPERHALWALLAALEKELVEPFSPDYKSLLAEARRSLVHLETGRS